jgi:predicted component of type VI protein secretion system
VALSILPEYSEAFALLAQIHRQQRNQRRAANALMHALTAPLCFGAKGRKKLLNWLQRMGEDVYPDCRDPLWQNRAKLTFGEGVIRGRRPNPSCLGH